jgi:hypothetical protein
MIGHEYIGMNSSIMTGTGIRQMMPKSSIIFIVNKNLETVVAKLDHMLWITRQYVTGSTGHGVTSL